MRIYLRSRQRPDMIVGTVEDAVSQGENPFHKPQELGALLVYTSKTQRANQHKMKKKD